MTAFAETVEYQVKVLALMLSDSKFRRAAASALDPALFSDKALQWYFRTLSAEAMTPVILQEEMKVAAREKVITAEEIDKYVHYYEHIKQRPVPVECEHVRTKLGAFVQEQAVKKAYQEAYEHVKAQRYDQVVTLMRDAIQQGVDHTDLGYDYFGEAQVRLAARQVGDVLEKLSTGIPPLDKVMYGGLAPKQLGLIVGGTGRGKSIFLEWLANEAVVRGKKVIYFTLELGVEDVAARFDALISQIKINELKTMNEEVFKHLMPKSGQRNLIIKEYPAKKATVGTLDAFLASLEGIGWVPDLVVVDYVDLLRSERAYNAMHEENEAVIQQLHGFAKEHSIPVWTATQLNRSGLVMDTPDEASIAGSIAKLYTCDAALFLAATNEERENHKLRIIVGKNRNGPAPYTLNLDTDFARMTFYRAISPTTLQPTIDGEVDEDPSSGNDDLPVATDTIVDQDGTELILM